MSANRPATSARIDAVRRFNRFYTQRIGVLQENLLDSQFALTEVRVLYELAHWNDGPAGERDAATASDLAARLGLDEGYLSRIVRAFTRRGYLSRTPSSKDARRYFLSLTSRGQKAFAPLEARSRAEVGLLLGKLSAPQQADLACAMTTIERVLGDSSAPVTPCTMRGLRPGDLGWVVQRHGAIYAAEYGYDVRFEALVAEIAAKFVQHFDSTSERCWIAERDGILFGSVFVVRESKTVAKLRLLLVEPSARGMGLGRRLVEECVRFARAAGYKTLVLWTQSELTAARAIYEKAGFVLADSTPHESFGRNLVAETWRLDLKHVQSKPASRR